MVSGKFVGNHSIGRTVAARRWCQVAGVLLFSIATGNDSVRGLLSGQLVRVPFLRAASSHLGQKWLYEMAPVAYHRLLLARLVRRATNQVVVATCRDVDIRHVGRSEITIQKDVISSCRDIKNRNRFY